MGEVVLALDLERTLISDALSAQPRPHLREFLMRCLNRFARIVLFTCVEKDEALGVLMLLADSGHVPPEFLDRLEYVEWQGEYKDLRFVPQTLPDEVLLVDDDPTWVSLEQRARWIAVRPWDGGDDEELLRVWSVIESMA